MERLIQMRENPPDRPRLGDERDEPDVAAAVRALEWKLLPHPCHQFGPGDPRGVVSAGLGGGTGVESGAQKATVETRQNEHVRGRKNAAANNAPNSRPLQGVSTWGRPIANPALSRRICNAGGGT
jgi:hypothetical protein